MREYSSSALHDAINDAIGRRGWTDDGTAIPEMVRAAQDGVTDPIALARRVPSTFLGRNGVTQGELAAVLEAVFPAGGLVVVDDSSHTAISVTGSTNVTVAIGSIIGRIENMAESVPAEDVREALLQLTDAIRTDESLVEDDRADALERVEFLTEQAASGSGQRASTVVRDVIRSFARVIEVSAALATLWQTSGPLITKYFGL